VASLAGTVADPLKQSGGAFVDARTFLSRVFARAGRGDGDSASRDLHERRAKRRFGPLVAGLAALVLLSVGGGVGRADLFVSDLNHNAVQEYDKTTGAFVRTFASGGGLSEPTGLAFGPNGDLFVSSAATNAVLEYNGTAGAFVRTFTSGGGLNEPIGLVFGPNGDLFVSGFNNNQVLEYNGTTGAFVKVFANTFFRGLVGPTGLVFGPNGDLFVASYNSSSGPVFEYNGATGAFVKVFTTGFPQPSSPDGLVFGPNGDLFVTNNLVLNPTILEYNGATGAFVKTFASELSGQIWDPVFGPNGNLFVSDGGGVEEYDGTTGAFIETFTSGLRFTKPTYMVFAPGDYGAPAIPAVPEPSALALFGLGSIALAVCGRRRARFTSPPSAGSPGSNS
jgi:streptogramin lyase